MKPPARLLHSAAPLLALVLASGSACRTYSHYRFTPAIHDVEVRAPDETVLASVLVSPRGIAVGEDEGLEMRFRVQVENRTDQELELVAPEFRLFDAGLTPFGAARVTRDAGAADAAFGVAFPFPAGATPRRLDLRSMQLRMGLRHGERLLLPSIHFERDHRWNDPYDPYYGPRWGFGFGYGWYCD